MRRRSQSWYQSKNRKSRRENLQRSSRLGVLARERNRLANPTPREPKLIRFYPIEIGVRDKITGDTAFVDFKSVRDAARRLSIIQKFYSPGFVKINVITGTCSRHKSSVKKIVDTSGELFITFAQPGLRLIGRNRSVVLRRPLIA